MSSNLSEINFNSVKEYIPKLRISLLRASINKSVDTNLVTFISSKTGSGKSTKVPIFLYEYLSEQKKKTAFNIICTEPRSIACESISKYIKKLEGNENKKISVSIKDYFQNKDKKYLFYLKESDLLYLLKCDPYLDCCDILIIDEVHERTMKLDLILYYLKYFTLSNREKSTKDFRLVLMSATFNSDNIYAYFSMNKNITFGFIDQNELSQETKEDNYDIIYSNNINNNFLFHGNTRFKEHNMGKLLREIVKIIRYEVYEYYTHNKTILVFLPDYKTIYSLYCTLKNEYRDYLNIYQFTSALSILDQRKIMEKLQKEENKCNIIIATTLAETCLTFPNCDVVIDCGLKKNNKYNYDSNLYEEVIEYISQDSCIQRSGRCGRSEVRGVSYRLFSEEAFNLMDKYRKPDIETGNIDLIILKLFENQLVLNFTEEEIKKKGYLDFLSKIEKEKYDKIVEKLIKYKAIKKNDNDEFCITQFGYWAMKANMDIELGYYFDNFKKKYPDEIKKESVFQLLNIISTADNYNCELFYTDINPDLFKFNLIDNNKVTKVTKTLQDFAKNMSNYIVNQVLIKYQKEIENKMEDKVEGHIEINEIKYIKNIKDISPYYYLFSKLDEIYGVKNFYYKNNIFQLGDWIISLYFMNQYKLIKCLRHYQFKNERVNCPTCDLSKYFYCNTYSLNEKFFAKQKAKSFHMGR